jgi:nicotinamide-nucleotide amidase
VNDMQALIPVAEEIAKRLIERRESVVVAESSTGGLIAAALLAVPGASAYFVGGAVVYTRTARAGLLAISDAEMAGMRASTEPYALLAARRMRERHGATWGIGETGAAGPTGNRYDDAAGHSCRGCRADDRARGYAGNRQQRPAGQYAGFRAARALAFCGADGEVAIPPALPSPPAPARGTRR